MAKNDPISEVIVAAATNSSSAYDDLFRAIPKDSGEKMMFIHKHADKLPAKLRPAIAQAWEECQKCYQVPETFLGETFLGLVHGAMGKLMFGRRYGTKFVQVRPDRIRVTQAFSSPWGGFDCEVDTHNEVELAIRIFPQLLDETNALYYPIQMLMTFPKAIPFVPLYERLYREIYSTHINDTDHVCRLFAPHKYIVEEEHSLDAYERTIQGECFGTKATEEDYYEKCLSAFICCHKECLLERIHYRKLIEKFSESNIYNHSEKFIDRRLRILVDCDPSLLVCKNMNWDNMYFLRSRKYCEVYGIISSISIKCVGAFEPTARASWIRAIWTAFELGMTHYPNQLGFLFHRITRNSTCMIHYDSIFCQISRFMKMDRTQCFAVMKKMLDPSIRLQSLVIAAATNEEICLDGVYFLVRSSPIEAIAVSKKRHGKRKSVSTFDG